MAVNNQFEIQIVDSAQVHNSIKVCFADCRNGDLVFLADELNGYYTKN